MNPLHAVALAVHNAKGAYALLLGSGVSRAAEVPTGWEVTLDLVRQVAALDKLYCEPDPAAWYRERFRAEPDYSRLMGQLARSAEDRRALLRPYFEPTDEERGRGVKQPTDAHRAIAALVRDGYVRVILTTNFDRLVEAALEAAGVAPSVVDTADAAQGALPLPHAPCTVVKLHGDYLDARLRNTAEELGSYPPALDALLDRVLDEYGLIVCGWSAEWDGALRAAIEHCPTRRFTTFWAARKGGELGPAAQRLVALRRAEVVRVADADWFFHRLAEDVAALARYERPHPLSARIARESLKRYVADPRRRVDLRDLVLDEYRRVHGRLTHPLDGGYPLVYHGTASPELLSGRLRFYEGLTETLRALLAVGCFWDEGGATPLWVEVLEGLATMPEFGGDTTLLRLRAYPALLALYAGGIAAVAAGRYDTLQALLTGPQVVRFGRRMALVEVLATQRVLDRDVARTIPGLERKLVPVSHYLFHHDDLWGTNRDLVPLDARFEASFDRFEYLAALALCDLGLMEGDRDPWVPVGYWAVRERPYRPRTPMEEVAGEIAQLGAGWPPLRGGMFGGDVARANAAKALVDARAERIGFQ